jgi:hypothetical protein
MARISKNNTATTTPVPVLMPLDVPLQKDDAETTDVVLPKETTKKEKFNLNLAKYGSPNRSLFL